jgi:hypothetical protein
MIIRCLRIVSRFSSNLAMARLAAIFHNQDADQRRNILRGNIGEHGLGVFRPENRIIACQVEVTKTLQSKIGCPAGPAVFDDKQFAGSESGLIRRRNLHDQLLAGGLIPCSKNAGKKLKIPFFKSFIIKTAIRNKIT